MTDEIKCFLLEPTTQTYYSLRRYQSGEYTCNGTYHDASFKLGKFDEGQKPSMPPRDDPQWPKKCKSCDYVFTDDDEWQLFNETVWVRKDTGEEMTLRKAPPGAMWFAFWMEEAGFAKGPDGRILIVKTPGGEWNVDSRASNCTRKDDDVHRCWIRHGTAPNITVDKRGDTCNAGAGSIQAGNYHGFLRNGSLVRC